MLPELIDETRKMVLDVDLNVVGGGEISVLGKGLHGDKTVLEDWLASEADGLLGKDPCEMEGGT